MLAVYSYIVKRLDDLIGKNDRGDELGDGCPLGLRDRETGRDMVARMTGNAADIGVIEVEIAEGGAIGEGCKIYPERLMNAATLCATGS